MRYAIEDEINQRVALVTAEDVYDLSGQIPVGAKVYAETSPDNWERVYIARVQHERDTNHPAGTR